MSNSNYLWEIILKDFKSKLNSKVFSTWIEPNYIESVNMMERKVTIVSSNSMISEYLQNVFDGDFKEILKTYTNLDFQIFYSHVNNESTDTNLNTSVNQTTNVNSFNNTSNDLESNILRKFSSNDDRNLFPKKSSTNQSYVAPEPTTVKSKKNTDLKKHFTFDNFVPSDGSSYAYSLASSAADSPGEHNPLFIYGGVGLGKTHLLHAIGNELEVQYPHFVIKCVSSEKILNDFVYSLQGANNQERSLRAEEFRKKYREIDALLIDDIQFLSGKTGIQTAFYHIFNELYMENKQIVLISDREPGDLDKLDDRLVSRFGSGVIADITPPDYVARMAIINVKCKDYGLVLDESIISYLSGISDNIRQIEGILKDINFKAKSGENISLSLVEDIIKHRIKTIKKSIQATDIINITSNFYNISVDDIKSAKRNKEVGFARMVAIYLCRDLTDLSLPAIGKIFNKDHSSIHYANSKITSMVVDNENNIVDDIEVIKDKLKTL